MDAILPTLAARMERELRENILPFWLNHTVDHANGGFYGALTNDLQVINEAPRSLVLTSRMLWTFSSAYRKYGDQAYLETANHACRYLIENFLDPGYSGMYWWVDCEGRPLDDRKQTYGQAFAIYALSEYFLATGGLPAIDVAREIFDRVEQKAYDRNYGGYIEGLTRGWGQLPDMRLSEKEPFCPKSMNTLLHLLEAYTNLLRAWPNPRLKQSHAGLLHAFLDHVIDPQTHTTRMYLDFDWTPLSDHISYGHDIETSWLITEAAEVLNDGSPGGKLLLERARRTAVQMAEAVYNHGLGADGSVLHEGSPRGVHDDTRHWWCQAEGVVGFVNAFQISGDEKYARAALRIWDYVESHMVDRQHGEWFKSLDRNGKPITGQLKAGPWEDPYHQSRACLEVIHRAARPQA